MSQRIVRVHRLNTKITQKILRDTFSPFGTILKITMPNRKTKDALVEYKEESSAKNAQETLDNTTLSSPTSKFNRKHHLDEFFWSLTREGEESLWENDTNDTHAVEKRIIKEKQANMMYIESLGPKIQFGTARQRKVVTPTVSSGAASSASSAIPTNNTNQ